MFDIYSQFRDFHVFKRFRYLLGDWWNLDILIVIKDGKKVFYDNVSPLNNSIVKTFLSSPLFKSYFLKSLSLGLNKKTKTGSVPQFLSWKQTGLDLFVVPLELKSAPPKLFLVATGFASKRTKELSQSLSYLGLSKKAIEQKIKTLKQLSPKDEVYIQKMLKILSEELFTLLQKGKKQESLIKQLYNKKSHKNYGEMLGKSQAMNSLFNFLEKIKNHSANILIEGGMGTGKRLLAKTIHNQSLRSKGVFYIQNFSGFKGPFLERELFSSSQNHLSKTAQREKTILEKLEGGTLFLNEIGNTSLGFQNKLLQFLKHGGLFITNSAKTKKTNIRVMASTSRDLKTLVEQEQFNEALYFAISTMTIKIPPLKHRKEDIALLAQHFLNKKSPLKNMIFSSQAMKSLCHYSWPGNIRELESEIEKIISLSAKDQTIVEKQDLSPHIQHATLQFDYLLPNGKQNLKATLRLVEKKILLNYLKRHNWNKSKVARLLGTSRSSIVIKAKEHGLFKEGA